MTTTQALPDSVFKLWVKDVPLAWLAVTLLAVLPAVVYASGLLTVMLLVGALVIFVPVTLITRIFTGKHFARHLRWLAVIGVSSILSPNYVFALDARIPHNAAPITQAVENYYAKTGSYPETLDLLVSQYLPRIPDLRFAVVQPRVQFSLMDGAPLLSIDSAAGDAFAKHEYDFTSRTWRHYG